MRMSKKRADGTTRQLAGTTSDAAANRVANRVANRAANQVANWAAGLGGRGVATLLASAAACTLGGAAAAQVPLDVIAFGSCAREEQDQPVWDVLIQEQPDLYIALGDNVYVDFWAGEDGQFRMAPPTSLEHFTTDYEKLAAKPGWQRLTEACPIIPTWDDHDYGNNDAGAEWAMKEDSQRIFLDFFGVPKDSPRRERDGVYHAETHGPAGRRVQVIMLDTRFFRSALDRRTERVAGVGPYVPTTDTTRTMLGDAQWAWLGEQLREPADVRIIASSIQVVAYEHGYETWGNLPHERERLYRLIDETNASGVIFLSGDRHLLEISRDVEDPAPYPMWDITSSGLTQAKSPNPTDPNRFRVGPVIRDTNYGIVRIAWGDAPESTEISLEGRGGDGRLLTRQSVFLSELQER